MLQTCLLTGQKFSITDEDKVFYQKMEVPIPRLCPQERMRRRLTWRNENTLYKRKCSATGKSIISIHHADKFFPVYENRYWWSDNWNPLSYGQNFDFNKPFFAQFLALQQKVPQIAIVNDNGLQSENCAYCQDFSKSKNCYLVTGSWQVRDCMYSNNVNYAQELYDCSSVNLQCELGYECYQCQNMYECGWLKDSENCSECWFGLDLKGCKNCFGCAGLRNKQFWIWNEPKSEAEYRDFMVQADLGSYRNIERWKAEWQKFSDQCPRRFAYMKNCHNCFGDELYNCKNVVGFDTFNSEDCKFVERGDTMRCCYDIVQTGHPEWCIDCVTPDDSYMTKYSTWTWKSKYCEYTDNCHSSEYLFGCISLRRAKHCILNKSYTKHEYDVLRQKIITHMIETGEYGEFFPSKYSIFGYNETQAQEYFPLTKKEAIERGFVWYEGLEELEKQMNPAFQIPDHIRDVPDSILRQTLVCSESGKSFRLQKAELAFYQKMNLPIPRLHPDVRRKNRLQQRNPRQIWKRHCPTTSEELWTTYPPDTKYKVLSERAYQKYIQ